MVLRGAALVKTRSDERYSLVRLGATERSSRKIWWKASLNWTEATVLGLKWSISVQGKPNVWQQGQTKVVA